MTAILLLLAARPWCVAGDPSEVAISAQRAWRRGDGDGVLALAHPTLVARIAELQTKWLEQEDRGTGRLPWVKYPSKAPTLAEFKALSIYSFRARGWCDSARSQTMIPFGCRTISKSARRVSGIDYLSSAIDQRVHVNTLNP